MTKPIISTNNTLEQWRILTNRISDNIGDPVSVYTTDIVGGPDPIPAGAVKNGADLYTHPADEINALVLAINNLNDRKVKRSGDTIYGSLLIKENLTIDEDVIIGSASDDSLTINGTAVSIPNSLNFDSNTFFIDSTNNRVAIGNNTPVETFDVYGTMQISGVSKFNSTTNSTAYTNGSVVVSGGVGVAGDINTNGNVNIAGDLTVNGGDVSQTSGTTINLFNTAQTTTANLFGSATTISIGSSSGATTINNDAIVNGGVLTVNDSGGVVASITTDEPTFNLLNASVLTVNAFGAATDINIGAATGDLTIRNATTTLDGDLIVNGGDVYATSGTSVNLFNTAQTTTANLFGSATSVTIGADSNTALTTIRSDLKVNGDAIITDEASFSVFDTPTTVTAFSAGTSVTVGANGTGTATIRNQNVVLGVTASGTSTINSPVINMSTGATGVVNIDSTKANTLGTLDGSLVVDGGASFAGNVTTGGDIRVTGGDIEVGGTPTIRAVTTTNAVNVFDTTTGAITLGATTSTSAAIRSQAISLATSGASKYVSVLADDDATGAANSTGSLRVAGGVGIAKRLYVGTSATITSNLTVGGNIDFNGVGSTTINHTGNVLVSNTGTVTISPSGNVLVSNTGSLSLTPTTSLTINPSQDTTIGQVSTTRRTYFVTDEDNTLDNENTGSVQFDGGVGIAKNLTVKATGAITEIKTGSSYIKGFSVTSGTSGVIESFSSSTFRSGKYLLQVTQGTTYGVIEFYIHHDGTTAYITEIGQAGNLTSAVSLTGSIATGVLSINFSSATASSFKVSRTLLVI